MSAVLLDPPHGVPIAMTLLPPAVWRKIVDFLAAERTGQIVLDVKEGRILAYKLTESGRVSAAELDRIDAGPHDSDT